MCWLTLLNLTFLADSWQFVGMHRDEALVIKKKKKNLFCLENPGSALRCSYSVKRVV